MSGKSKKSGGRPKERGLNVRVVQENKTQDNDKVRVNCYDGKNTSKKRKKTAKNTSDKKLAEVNKVTELELDNKKEAKKEEPVSREVEDVAEEEKAIETRKEDKTEPEPKEASEIKQGTEGEIESQSQIASEEKVDTQEEIVSEEKNETQKETPSEVKSEVQEEVKDAAETKKQKTVAEKVVATKETEIEAKTEAESKTEADAKVEAESKIEAKNKVEAESKAKVKEETKNTEEGKNVEIVLPEDDAHFETLMLNTDTKKPDSKIILRDVAKDSPEVEAKRVQPVERPTPTKQRMVTKPAKAPIKKNRKLSAREFKDREIKKAINNAAKLPMTDKARTRKPLLVEKFGWARLALMITCATTAVFSIVYFLNIASADVPLMVVAAQSGIEASYPEYIPRGYELSDVTSSSGKVTMSFKSEDGLFVLNEESSNWDSNGLLNNYIRENYTDDSYTVLSEQGLTIYMGNNWEAWVSGGILYKLTVKTGSLTKKQLKTIATSL